MFKLIGVLIVLLSSAANAEIVRQQEINVGTSEVSYMDPEIEAGSLQISFINMRDGGLYLSKLDPSTGRFVDHNYKFLDTPSPIYKTFNGPEWGYSVNGPSIYYTKPGPDGKDHNFRYRDGKIDQLDSGDLNLVANYCSKNEQDASTWVMGAEFDIAKIIASNSLTWGIFDEATPDALKFFQMSSIGKGPRFVPNARQVTTNLVDAKGLLQGFVYDIDQGKHIQITRDAGRKNSLYAFRAPELGNEMLMSANVLAERLSAESQKKALATFGGTQTPVEAKLQLVGQVAQAIRVYRKASTGWVPYKEVRPAAGKLLMNPQVFSYKGKTLFTMEQFTVSSMINNHSVVIQDLAGKINITVSAPTEMLRLDPEVVVVEDKIYVYYYHLGGGGLYMSEVQIPDSML